MATLALAGYTFTRSITGVWSCSELIINRYFTLERMIDLAWAQQKHSGATNEHDVRHVQAGAR